MGGPFDTRYGENVKRAIIRAVLDGDHEYGHPHSGECLTYGRARRAAQLGLLRGIDKLDPAPSVTSISEWCRAEQQTRDLEELGGVAEAERLPAVAERLARRAMSLIEHEMDRLEREAKRPQKSLDVAKLVRLTEPLGRLAKLEHAAPSKNGQDKDKRDALPETSGSSGLVAAVHDRASSNPPTEEKNAERAATPNETRDAKDGGVADFMRRVQEQGSSSLSSRAGKQG